jgi:hypothetical protein
MPAGRTEAGLARSHGRTVRRGPIPTPFTGPVRRQQVGQAISNVGRTFVPQTTPVRLGRTGSTLLTTPSLAHLLGADAQSARFGDTLPAGQDLVHYQNHQRRVLNALISDPNRGKAENHAISELLREYHPKTYKNLVAGYLIRQQRKAGTLDVPMSQLRTAKQQRQYLYQTGQTAQARAINQAAEFGKITHPNMPHGFTAFVGDLIPDTPAEIALAAGTAGAGTIVGEGGVAGVRLGSAALKGVRDLRVAGAEALGTVSRETAAKLGQTAAAQTIRGTGRLVSEGIRHRGAVQAAARGVGRVTAARAAGATGLREAAGTALDVGSYAAQRTGAKIAEEFPTVARAGQLSYRGAQLGYRGARFASAPARAVLGNVARHPYRYFGAGPVLVQAPSASQSRDPLATLKQGLSGTGLAATTINTIANDVAAAAPGTVAQNIVKDALNLPAQALPSVYLPLAAAVEFAAKGDDSRAKKLLSDYGKTGIFPALLHGNVSQALDRLKQHPLFGALELSGGYALAGRGAGMIARSGVLGPGAAEYAAIAREPLRVYGHQEQRREYSRNLITARAQRRGEAAVQQRGARFAESLSPRRNPAYRDPTQATPRQAEHFLRGVKLEGIRNGAYGAVDRHVDRAEQVRRINQQEVLHARAEARPEAHSHTIPAEIAQGSVRTPETFHEDLRTRREELLSSLHATGEHALSRREKAAVRAQLDAVEKALKLPADSPRIPELFASAEAYAKDLGPHEQALHELGLYAPEAIRTAKLFPFAQRHMGATFGRPAAVEERLAQIDAELKGQAPPGEAPTGNVRGHRHNVKQATREVVIAIKGAKDAELKLQTARRNNKGTERGNQLEAQARLAVVHANERLKFAQKTERDLRAMPRQTKAQAIRESRDALRAERSQLLMDHPEGLIGKDGRKLDPAAVEAEAEKQMGRQPAFLTHRPGFRGRGNYYQPFYAGRGRGIARRRTGEAFRRGLYDSSYEALTEQHLHMRTVTDRARNFDATIEHFALKKPNGDWYKSWNEAQAVARDPEAHGIETHGIPMVPIRRAPMRAMARELAASNAGDHANAELMVEEALTNPDRVPLEMRQRVANAMEQAMQPGTGKGDVGLIPEAVVERLREHNAPPRTAEKIFQSYTSAFKNTVLPLSDKWLLGNTFEVEMRSLFNGLGLGQPGLSLGNRRFANRYLKAFEEEHGPEATKQFVVQTIGGGHYSSVARTEVFRRDMHGFSRAFNYLISKPGARQIYGVWDAYKSAIFRGNSWFERQPQYAALGKVAKREVQQRIDSWHGALHVSDEALHDLVKGDIHTAAQEKYARYIEDVFGKWGKNSPAARHFLVGYAPFYMWARAASRFVLVTLPFKHPIKTALIAAGAEMTQTEREKYGLDLFAKNRVPGFLMGGIPLSSGGLQPTSNYSSFGVFADYPAALANFVLPQFGGLDTLRGISWRGDQIQLSGGGQPNVGQLVALAAYTQLEATMPVLALARRVEEGGGSSADTSTVLTPKVTKGTQQGRSLVGGLERAFGLRSYDRQTLAFLRTLAGSRQINVPANATSTKAPSPGGGGSSQWWSGGSSGGSSGGGGTQWWSH